MAEFRLGDPEEGLRCRVCGLEKPRREVDRLLWCEECVQAGRARAATRSWAIGALLALVLGSWIWLYIRPSDLVLGGWIAVVVAGFWLGARIGREVLFGIYRSRTRIPSR